MPNYLAQQNDSHRIPSKHAQTTRIGAKITTHNSII